MHAIRAVRGHGSTDRGAPDGYGAGSARAGAKARPSPMSSMHTGAVDASRIQRLGPGVSSAMLPDRVQARPSR